MYRGLLDTPKDGTVVGTYETSAFILSLRDRDEFARLHPSGYHYIPHIGTYGQDYTLSLPMVLLSLPATPSYLQKLPTDVLNALDLEHFTSTPNTNSSRSIFMITPPNSPTDMGNYHQPLDRMSASRQTSPGHLIEIQIAARDLVENVLLVACQRVALYNDNLETGCGGFFSSSVPIRDDQPRSLNTKSFGCTIESDWPISKKGSSVSVESEGYGSASSGFNSTVRKVSFQNHSCSVTDEEYDHEVYITAKKLVNKALHLACKKVESMLRRSSIEYLIASTKRIKIDDSSSPPPNFSKESQNSGHLFRFSKSGRGRMERSPTPEGSRLRKAGSKRQRSGSHDVAMQDDQDLKKPSTFGKIFTDFQQKVVLRRPNGKGNQSSQLGSEHGLSTLGDLAFNMGRMSIVEDSESDIEAVDEEESFTILSAVERQPQVERYMEPSREHEQAHVCAQVTLDNPDSKTFPREKSLAFSPPTRDYPEDPRIKMDIPAIVLNNAVDSDRDVILDMDIFIIIHSNPRPNLCQKICCSNTDEVNLVYHCWLYQDSPFVPGLTLNNKLEMGVFSPSLVRPVHLQLHDCGLPFHLLDERTVCIHNCCFSPENAQLQLVSPEQHNQKDSFHSFFSAAKHGSRRVVAFHVIPSSESVEELVREIISGCSNLGQLLKALKNTFPEVGDKIANLILPQRLAL